MAEDKPGGTKSRTLSFILGGGVAVLLICCGGPMVLMGLVGVGHKVQEQERGQKVAEAKTAVKVSAEDLFQAFKNNEVSANQTYKGQVVELTGTIHAVKERYVELNEDHTRFIVGLVHVHFEGPSKGKLGALGPGQLIRAKGVCTGKSFVAVDVKNAQLVD